jgi:hypothetical protein
MSMKTRLSKLEEKAAFLPEPGEVKTIRIGEGDGEPIIICTDSNSIVIRDDGAENHEY